MQTLSGYKSYFIAAAMALYAGAAAFLFPSPYNLTPDQALAVLAAAGSLVGLRSGLTTEVQKIVAALGIDVLGGQAKTVADVQAQASPLVRALRTIASPAGAKTLTVFLGLMLFAPLMGCAALQGIISVPTPKTPAQTVYVAKGYFASSLVLAVEYAGLSTCPTGAPICKTQAVLDQVRSAAHSTKDLLDAADTAVNLGGADAGAKADAALHAAESFQSTASTLKVK